MSSDSKRCPGNVEWTEGMVNRKLFSDPSHSRSSRTLREFILPISLNWSQSWILFSPACRSRSCWEHFVTVLFLSILFDHHHREAFSCLCQSRSLWKNLSVCDSYGIQVDTQLPELFSGLLISEIRTRNKPTCDCRTPFKFELSSFVLTGLSKRITTLCVTPFNTLPNSLWPLNHEVLYHREYCYDRRWRISCRRWRIALYRRTSTPSS